MHPRSHKNQKDKELNCVCYMNPLSLQKLSIEQKIAQEILEFISIMCPTNKVTK